MKKPGELERRAVRGWIRGPSVPSIAMSLSPLRKRRTPSCSLRLPLRHFQPLATPDPLDLLYVHRPATVAQQSRDPPIAVPSVRVL